MEKMVNLFISATIGILLALAVFGIRFITTYGEEEKKQTKTTVIWNEIADPIIIKGNPEMVIEHKEKKVYTSNENVPLDDDLQLYAQELCDEYEVSYPFFLAICESESSFDTEAVGDSGKSRGLMQINKVNWTRYDLDASMVYDNIEIGIRMLSELIEKYKDIDAVTMAYKCGESRANELISEGVRLAVVEKTVDRISYWSEVTE